MAETHAIIDFAPLACTIGYALLGSDASQCQCDWMWGKLGGFCYGLAWYRMLGLAYALAQASIRCGIRQYDSIWGNIERFRLWFSMVEDARFRLGFAVRWYLIWCELIRLHTGQSRRFWLWFGRIWYQVFGRFLFCWEPVRTCTYHIPRGGIFTKCLLSTAHRSKTANGAQTHWGHKKTPPQPSGGVI